MSLPIGARLGSYEVLSPLGAGGMGEVYRARDTKLGRDVALKVLPEAFTADPDRLARFEREAKVLASLNHPHIAQIYGLEEADGQKALVLELVEGPTLADRITQGAIPPDEAFPLAKQIAEALEAAHEQGIIHRDLKPANVKVKPDGTVKVLDFGLAKAFEPEGSDPNASHSPTLTARATQMGVILGTAAYMSPEQARGKPVDKRADIWAFGVVLYEMLTGRRPFIGEDVSPTLAEVMKSEPDWSRLPGETPRSIRRLLRRCLEKSPQQRMRDIGDARLEVEESIAGTPLEGRGGGGAEQAPRHLTTPVWAFLIAALLVAAIAGGLIHRWLWTDAADESALAGRSLRASVSLPLGFEPEDTPDAFSPAIAVSPDGKTLALVGEWNGVSQLFLRDLQGFEITPVAGTEGATSPFFSPDSEWVGFHTDGKFKRVPRAGGAVVTVCDAPLYRGNGVDWGTDDTIVFTWAVFSGLYRVPASGGTPKQLTAPDSSAGERGHSYPHFLPDGKSVLFSLWPVGAAVLSLETGEWKTVLPGSNGARYLPTGHLLDIQDPGLGVTTATLMAVPFDLERLEVIGPAVPVLDDVHYTSRSGRASFSVSRTGLLTYLPARTQKRWLAWVDRAGRSERITREAAGYESPRLSPGGRTIAFQTDELWTLDLERGTRTRVTVEGFGQSPVWGPSGERIAFSLNRGAWNLFQKTIDSVGEPELLLKSEQSHFPDSWSPDGEVLAFNERNAETGDDIWLLSDDGQARPFLATGFDEYKAQFSPDGRFIAYVSNETGSDQVYVRQYPSGVRRWTISTAGGTSPLWSRDGRELFYRDRKAVVAVATGLPGEFRPGAPRTLFEGPYARDLYRSYDVDLDGKRFLMVEREVEPTTEVRLVTNWFPELERLARAGE